MSLDKLLCNKLSYNLKIFPTKLHHLRYYTGCLKKKTYNSTNDDPNENSYTGNEMTKNTTNLSEHLIFLPSIHLWQWATFKW
jgi:hypothetical protein